MKKLNKKFLAAFMSVAIIFSIVSEFFGNVKTISAATTKNTIWIIGDSTVSEFNDNYYYPRYGYGTQFENYFDSSKYDIKNLAL